MKTKKAQQSKKTASKKVEKTASKKTTKKAPARKKVKVMTVREIAAECASQLRDQHTNYNKFREQLTEAVDNGGSIQADRVMAMLDKVVMSDRDAKEIIDGFILFALNEVEEKGEFTIPNMVKVFARYRKALPKREGRNPATGDTIMLKARKASYKAAARPMKGAKDAMEKFAKKNPAK